MTSVYVAAPFSDADIVRSVHARLADIGIFAASSWAEHAIGREDFSKYTPDELRRFAAVNDADLRLADVCLVLARYGAGAEMFAEARLAIEWGKPVVWVGRRTLSSWRDGVTYCETLEEALRAIDGWSSHDTWY